MANYEREHAAALRAMKRKGVEVSFSAATGSTYNPTGGTWSEGAASATVTGWAVEKPMEPEEFLELSQIITSPVLLVFIPSVFGQRPVAGQTLTWAQKKRTVARVLPIRPAEDAFAARVVLG